MKPRRVIDRTETPDGEPVEFAFEAGRYVLRVAGATLMTSATHASEQEMAKVAADRLEGVAAPRVLVGGLGMGFTLRAALDVFGDDAEITVAEILAPLVRYNRGELGDVAQRPLDDPRVTLYRGDVRERISHGDWDAILLDVDNGPDAFTLRDNASLYGVRGSRKLVKALRPGGVLVVWSAYPSPDYERSLRRAGLEVKTERIRARGKVQKGGLHVLFVAQKPKARAA